ncbi:patatin-like phospholipase family protein [Trichlorobacter lovleyi]|uniref:patatin-like phospholipase family protein n=1 Tax=Trichlorobacter lovleyi TaxID=313985 RepID=UPI0022401ADE|nr:patatin-like phospholipase family protein [Trichlorobacter lovleyi]QOX80386.1 patatin-like phospholipase family protein [Trichlorobacter lovleyi]
MANCPGRKKRNGASKIGLALGSGSARGLAHLGVIRALEATGIKTDFIAGTSIGALIGAVYASGKLDLLESTFQRFDWKRTASVFDIVFPKSGLIDGAKVSELVRAHIDSEVIESLAIPFCAVATDIQTGEEVVIGQGDVIEAVRASISVPGIFTPTRSNGRLVVDGGLVNPVPVSVVRAMGADIVIAVDLNHQIVTGKNLKPLLANKVTAEGNSMSGQMSRWMDECLCSMHKLKQKLLAQDAPASGQFNSWLSPEPLPNIFELLLASVNIMETSITEYRLRNDKPDMVIRPPLGEFRFLEFNRAEEIIAIGYESAREQLMMLKRSGIMDG